MSKTQPDKQDSHQKSKSRQFSLSIGMRLALAFMVIIFLTALIGALAIQQFSTLSSVTTELKSHDLPESITLIHLRGLLYRERDLEQSLLNGGIIDKDVLAPSSQPTITPWTLDPTETPAPYPTVEDTPSPGVTTGPTQTSTPTTTQNVSLQSIIVSLKNVLREISDDRQKLLSFEQPDTVAFNTRDFPMVLKIADGLVHTNDLSTQVQALVQQGQTGQATQIEQQQQQPLLLSLIGNVNQLSILEQNETSIDATNAQQQSGLATILIFALTVLGLVLSIVLALVITRSLTIPLKVLLTTTEAIAAGDLSAEESQVERIDEIGRLATAYDKMRLSLHSTIASLSVERQQTQAIIDATADGVILLDAQYRILKYNPAAEQLTGWKTVEAIGLYCWEILGGKGMNRMAAEASDKFQSLFEVLQTKAEPSYLEMPVTSRTGNQRWLAISCAPMPVDDQIGGQQLVLDLHDISQLKAVEQLKTDFVSMVSHELRAPLTTVTSSVEMLSLLDAGTEGESYREVVNILDQQTQRLRQVVEEVLQLTRLDAGYLEADLQPVSLTELLRGIVERGRAEWIVSDHWIILREPRQDIQVWADRALLEIVFRNLFDNARKYAPQGTPVEVETEWLQSTGQVKIRVIDHGPGIPADQLEHIFERFSRGAQSSYHWTRGYGLGLYIVRELLRTHNGTIQAERHPEGGACFVLSLWAVTEDSSNPFEGVPQIIQ